MSMTWHSIGSPQGDASMASMSAIALPFIAKPQKLCLARDASPHPNRDTLHHMKV